MVETKLNFGSIVEENKRIKFTYNANGFSANVVYNYLMADSVIKLAKTLDEIADRNIAYLDKYIGYIKSGKFVAKAKSGAYMVFDTEEMAKQACIDYQDGFDTMMTIDDFTGMKQPYALMEADAKVILNEWSPVKYVEAVVKTVVPVQTKRKRWRWY